MIYNYGYNGGLVLERVHGWVGIGEGMETFWRVLEGCEIFSRKILEKNQMAYINKPIEH